MKTLEISQMENIQGGGFVDGFCLVVLAAAIAQGAVNPFNDVVALGCLVYGAVVIAE